ncbi:MAG: aminoacyl-tRNA deacylase [Caulobacterales bacterium]
MTIASRIKDYLDSSETFYETVPHPRTATSARSAEAAHVPGDGVAKSVVIHHEEGYVLAVVPSTCRVDLRTLQEVIDRRMGLASETEVESLFDDCDSGAVPALGAPYGVPMVIDRRLEGQDAIWFEGGDHKTLVKMSGSDFDRLTRNCKHASFSRRA